LIRLECELDVFIIFSTGGAGMIVDELGLLATTLAFFSFVS
jgi:hypothetical protein